MNTKSNLGKSRKRKRASDQTSLTISLPRKLKRAIEDEAAKQHRSVSNYLVVELTWLVESKKAMKDNPQAVQGMVLMDEPTPYLTDSPKAKEA